MKVKVEKMDITPSKIFHFSLLTFTFLLLHYSAYNFYLFTFLPFYLYESSSILFMGFTASRAMSASTSTSGHSYLRALYIFNKVFIFI